MEIVTHTCGQQLWRHESRSAMIGWSPVVVYGRLGDTREIDSCPRCGENLRDAALTDEDGQPVQEPPSNV